MISLGLDPSVTGFGWCVHSSTELRAKRIVASGVLSSSAQDLFVTRNANFRAILVHILDSYPIEAVGVESPPFGESWSEGLYALFVFVNEAIYLSRRDVVYFDPQTLKMLTKLDPSIRRGTMDKSDMVEAVRAETGKRLNHNAADAYLLARSAARFWELLNGTLTPDDLTPAEAHSFQRVHTFTKGKREGQTIRGGLVHRENDRFHRFSARPVDVDEEEFRVLLCQKGRSILDQKGIVLHGTGT